MVGSRGVAVGSLRVRWRLASLAWLLPLGLVACGGKTQEPTAVELCPEICAKAKQCPGAPAVSSCDDLCLGEDARAEATGCRAEYEASEKCLAELDDVCTGNKDCSKPISATQTCELRYCMQHLDEEVCIVPTQ